MYCGQCGAEMEAAAGFCGKCGASAGGQMAATLQPGGMLAQEVSYPKAGLWSRFWASLLDGIIGGSLAIVGSIVGLADSTIGGVIYFIGLVVSFVYGACKDGLNDGQSYGKKLMGLKVVLIRENKPCTKVASLLRFITMLIPFVSLVECVMVLATDKGRRLGDKLAKTQVIKAQDYRG